MIWLVKVVTLTRPMKDMYFTKIPVYVYRRFVYFYFSQPAGH